MAFSTAALIIVLSVFNGLDELLHTLNNSFDPEIKIESAKGKSFEVSQEFLDKIKQTEGVEIVTEVIEDYAYVRYRDANQVVTLKGVSDNFIDQHRMDDKIADGKLQLTKGDTQFAIVGRGVQYALSIAVGNRDHALQVYYINNIKSGTLDPSRLYSRRSILPGGAFSIIQGFDENYVIVPLAFSQELMNYGNRRTSLEIKTKADAEVSSVQDRLKQQLGEGFVVLNGEEQHQDLYRLMKTEKLFFFLAFSVLLAISAINIFFSLMMLALDKKKDISVLAAMGANNALIKKIFLTEGALIAFGGTLLGLTLGGIFCWIQLKFGVISMGMETSVTEGYPIKVIPTDFLYTMLVVAFITIATSYRPAVLAARSAAVKNL